MTTTAVLATGFITNTILQNLISFLAPVVAIALVIFCTIQGIQIFKGGESGSPKKLICGVILILFILGIMYAAGSFDKYGQAFQGLTDTVIDKGAEDAGNIVG